MKEQHSSRLRKIGCLPASTLKPEERDFVADSGALMHIISKKGLEWCWNGYLDEILQSYDSHNRQWRSANAWRGNSVRQRIGHILDNESPRKHSCSMVARKALRWKRIFLWMDQRSKSTSQKNGIRTQCNSENFVPIVGLGFSPNSSSGSDSSTSRILSRNVESLLIIIFKLVFITYRKWYQDSRTRGKNWKWHLCSDCFNYGWWKIGETRCWSSAVKFQKTKNKNNRKSGETRCWRNGETRYFLKSWSDCKNSEEIWWMKFLNRETLTPFLFSWSLFRAHIQETWGFSVNTQCL